MSQPIRMSLVAALLAVLGCSSSGGSGGSGSCPTSPPTSGSSCLLMNGTSCSYATPGGGPPAGYCGGGGGLVAICQNGTWMYEATAGAGGGVYAACPLNAPAQGSSCTPSCGGAQQQCTYDCAHCGGYNCSASCSGSTWNVVTNETSCPAGDAGVPEGGTDADTDGSASEAGGDAAAD